MICKFYDVSSILFTIPYLHNSFKKPAKQSLDYTLSRNLCQVLTKLTCLAVIGLLLSTCGGAPPTLKIGLIAPFEGTDRALGYEALFAVKLAVQQYNETHQPKIELVALNDFNDPYEAKAQAKALLADPDIMGVIGHFSNEATHAALPIYEAHKLAVVIPWTVAHDSYHGAVSIAANTDETLAKLTQLQQQLAITQVELITTITTLPLTSSTYQLDLDGVQTGQMITILRQQGQQPLFGLAETGTPQIIQMAGAQANGFTFVSPGPSITDITTSTNFAEVYQTLSGLPSTPRAILTYDATNVLLTALAQIEATPNRAKVREIIKTITHQGLSGAIAFNETGQRRNAPVWVYQITDTRYPGSKLSPP